MAAQSLTLLTMRDRDWDELQRRVSSQVDAVTLQMLFDEIVAQADARLRMLRGYMDRKHLSRKAAEAFATSYRRSAGQYAQLLCERDALAAQLVALTRYAVHSEACAQLHSAEPCSCGLAALVAVPELRRGFPRAV